MTNLIKYPGVFLESVRLLDVLSTTNTRGGKVHIKGFIGYVNRMIMLNK